VLTWVLFDLNGTLVDPAVMAQPLGDTAGDEELVLRALDEANHQAWVLTLGGVQRPFKELFDAACRRELTLAGRDAALAGDMLALLSSMPAYLDAPAALEQLRGVGLRLGVLTQSAGEAADAVLRFAGLRDRIEMVLSAPESGAFKPDLRPYRMAVERTGASPEEVGFVAAHWWDVAGAKHAGLRTGWVARRDIVLPGSVPEPDVSGRDLTEVCDGLARLAG
jgi:2-haloacid dehalogenase